MLYKALDNYKLIELEGYEVDNLRADSKNIFYKVDFKSEVSLRQLNKFNYMRKSLNFKSLVFDFIESTGLKEHNINEATIFNFKEKITIKV